MGKKHKNKVKIEFRPKNKNEQWQQNSNYYSKNFGDDTALAFDRANAAMGDIEDVNQKGPVMGDGKGKD